MRPFHVFAAPLASLALTALAQQSTDAKAGLRGNWQGTLNAGLPLRLAFSITEADGKLGGTIRSIDQGDAKLALSAVHEKDGVARLEVAMIGGKFEGKLNDAGNEIAGTWSQGGMKLPLTLKRSEEEVSVRKPQEPKGPFPYREEQITISSTGDVKLAGTFTLPRGDGPHPAVVLITGSGPQDRDEAIMGHRPFLVLADHLARNGIAVLRCDDRGFAKSTGNHVAATTPDFADDARSQLAWLRQRKEVDPKRTGIIGHSEGGIVAPMVASKDTQTAFIVLLAGVGVPTRDLLVRQMEDLARLDGGDEKKIAQSVRVGREALGLLTENLDDAALEKRLRTLQEEARREMAPDELAKAPSVEAAVGLTAARMRSPWLRWLIRYDPAPALREVKCPVLAIVGEKDVQVAAKENIEAIARALAAGGNKNATTKVFPALNHLFQTCTTGSPKEYAQIQETISPAVLAEVSEWILKTVPR